MVVESSESKSLAKHHSLPKYRDTNNKQWYLVSSARVQRMAALKHTASASKMVWAAIHRDAPAPGAWTTSKPMASNNYLNGAISNWRSRTSKSLATALKTIASKIIVLALRMAWVATSSAAVKIVRTSSILGWCKRVSSCYSQTEDVLANIL